MGELSIIELVGYWLSIFLTLAILSFLYKDNPFYKVAEHLFIGVSIGYVITKQYYDVVRPKLIEKLIDADGKLGMDKWWYLIAAILAIALMFKLSKRHAWVARYPIAAIVGFYAGLQINGVTQGDLTAQARTAMASVAVEKIDINRATDAELKSLPGISPAVAQAIIERRKSEPLESLDQVASLPGISAVHLEDFQSTRGSWVGLDAQATASRDRQYYWFGIFSQLLLLLGLVAGLVYFYFSTEQTGIVGRISRAGIWILMIGFGAAFGYTVQGRLSLAIGRVLDISGETKDPLLADQINGPLVALVCLVFLIAGLVIWERKNRAAEQSAE